jgi:hypothetical protein
MRISAPTGSTATQETTGTSEDANNSREARTYGNNSSRKDVGTVGAPSTGGEGCQQRPQTAGTHATPTAAITSTTAKSTARAEATGTSQTPARDAIKSKD